MITIKVASYPSVHTLGWIHAHWQAYAVLWPWVRQLKVKGYSTNTNKQKVPYNNSQDNYNVHFLFFFLQVCCTEGHVCVRGWEDRDIHLKSRESSRKIFMHSYLKTEVHFRMWENKAWAI